MALRLPKLVFGTISRTLWHLSLLWLAWRVFWGAYMSDVMANFGADATTCFLLSTALTFAICYPLAGYVLRDDRLTNGVARDICIGLFYLFMLAPLLSVEMLPELPVDKDTFADIGIQVPKGSMVTRDHLDIVHKALWEASPRNDTIPWKLASTTMFAPRVKFSLPRRDVEHSTRHLTRVRMGETTKEYDLLMLKFWVPLTASLDDELGEDAPKDREARGDGDAGGDGADEDGDKGGDDAGDKEDEGDEEGGNADAAGASANNATVAADDGPAADTASHVYLVARASPRLGLWPHPRKKNKKKQEKIMKRHIQVCGKLFNGVPGGDAVDEAAQKLNRNLREDPNSLAFSIRTDPCGGDPFIFGPSGRAVYWFLLPVYLVLRAILGFFAATVLQEHEEMTLREELAEIVATVRGAFRSVTGGKKKE